MSIVIELTLNVNEKYRLSGKIKSVEKFKSEEFEGFKTIGIRLEKELSENHSLLRYEKQT